MGKHKRIGIAVAALLTVALAVWVLWGNSALELNEYTVVSQNLPVSFDGYRIAHVSDLHNHEFGQNNQDLLTILRQAEPDIIAITGDVIDSRNTNIDIALEFAAQAAKIAPCYYVTGNHEERIQEYERLKQGLLECGVTVLENEKVDIRKGEESITILGVDDPSFTTGYLFGDADYVMEEQLDSLVGDGYQILLSHRPEMMDIYVAFGLDLVLSGHAHGGQVRLPFVGGLAAPNQGLFPEYDSGLFTQGRTNMIVSRGIGNSIIPLRVNNRPEVILIVLSSYGSDI